MNYYYTIITSTYNCGIDFTATAESIKLQQRSDIQWIVIDGASDAETLDIIYKHKDVIHTFISEPDAGIYDAWNKAAKYILGNWVIFLGAGDIFHSATTLNEVQPSLTEAYPLHTIAYGKLNIYSPYNGKLIKTVGEDLSRSNNSDSIRPVVPLHPETFQHRSLFQSTFVFDTSFKIVGDTDFLNKFYTPESAKFIDQIITDIRGGGVSQHLRHSMTVFDELMRIARKNKTPISTYTFCKNYIYFRSKKSLSYLISDRIFWYLRDFLNK